MRRPLCAAALLYCLAVLALLQIMPPDTEDYSAYHKSTVTIEGTVVSKEYKTSSSDGSVRLLITLRDVTADDWTQQPSGRVMCRVGDGTQEDAAAADERAMVGARVRITGTLYSYSRATNSGEFDAGLYYQILGYTSFQLQYASLLACGTSKDPLGNTLYQVKRYLAAVLDACLTQEDASILKAMLLGEKGSLTTQMKSLYLGSGIIHILAISGLHISIIGMGLFRLLRRAAIPLPVSAAAAIGVMFLYGTMTGMGASSVRAMVMFLMQLAAMVLRRTYDMLTAISAAGLLLLISQPLYLYHSGFLFSFSAVLGIALLMPVFTSKGMKTLSVTLATLPVYLVCYSTFPIYSIVINLLVLPLMSVVMVSGLAVLCAGALWTPAGGIVGILPHVILMFYKAICSIASILPGHQINIGAPSVWQIVVYLLLLSAIVFSKDDLEGFFRRRALLSGSLRHAGPAGDSPRPVVREGDAVRQAGSSGDVVQQAAREETAVRHAGSSGEIPRQTEREEKDVRRTGYSGVRVRNGIAGIRERIAGTVTACAQKDPTMLPELLRILTVIAAVLLLCLRVHTGLSIHVIDVGQGDGLLIRCSDANLLVDGGSTSKSSVGEYQLTPLLQYYGVRTLDYIVITHPDSDHISGALEILKESRTHRSGWKGMLIDDSGNGITVGALCLPSAAGSAQDDNYAELIAAAREKNIPILYLKEGDVLEGETLRLTCLHPQAQSEYDDANEMSITLYLEYGSFTALLTGDLEGDGEERMLEYLRSEDSPLTDTVIALTLLKVAHHGSSGATSEAFLDVFRPTLAVISCGVGNSYGHPHQDTLDRLVDAGVQTIYDTRTGGEITFHTDGETVRITQFGGELKD